MTGLRLDWAAASDTGLARANNQDSAVVDERLFAVADGMGGHAAGEVASSVAVQALRDSASRGVGLVEAVHDANRAVWERAGQDPSLRGMGTTLCAVTLVDADGGPQILVVNVGDSRVYLFRDGELQQITDDHSLVADLMREGRLSPDEARYHPQRNILTRVLGNDSDVEVDEFPIDPYRGDRFLLCSDGLFNEVDEVGIADVLRRERDPQAAADELVRLANQGGGRDNITVVLVDVVDDGDRARRASAALAGAAATTTSAPSAPIEPRTSAMPAITVEPETAPEPAPVAHEQVTARERRPRRVTWRSVAFTLALLLVAGAVAGSVWWFGRNTFYVGVDGDQVTIFRGRPGGVLWIEPTVEQRYRDLAIDDVPVARQADVRSGKEQSTLADARAYVERLRGDDDGAGAGGRTPTTSTTSSTTTTSILGFGPGTTPSSTTP